MARRFDLVLQMHGDGCITNSIVSRMGAKRMAGFCPARRQENGHRAGPFMDYPDGKPEIRRLLALVHFLGAAGGSESLEFPLFKRMRLSLPPRRPPSFSAEGATFVCMPARARPTSDGRRPRLRKWAMCSIGNSERRSR